MARPMARIPASRMARHMASPLFGSGGFRPGGGGFGGFGSGGGFDLGDLFGNQAAGATGGGGLGDLLGGLFNRRGGGPTAATRTRRGQDVETDIRIDFTEA